MMKDNKYKLSLKKRKSTSTKHKCTHKKKKKGNSHFQARPLAYAR